MNFVVIGAGAWGTAFALHLCRLKHAVTLVPRRPEQASILAAARENTDYLPGMRLPSHLAITSHLESVLVEADVVFIACPSQSLRETAERLGRLLVSRTQPLLVLSLAKGLELGTHLRPTQILASVLSGAETGALTGPTNAGEVARGLPAAMVLAAAGASRKIAGVQAAISSPTLRVYTNDDLPGVEFGGALKNIYAIAAGCADGLHLGDNAKAGLLTRALAEMVRVGSALGARPETFCGLSGFGDLVATCYGGWSRNREFGQRIGEGGRVAELLSHRKTVVEGYRTTEAFADLCAARAIDAPILREMHAILFAGRRPVEALATLMMRGLKDEASGLPLTFFAGLPGISEL